MRAEDRLDQNGQKLIRPDHAARGVDRADPVPIAIERDAEMEVVVRDHAFQIGKVRLDRRIGVMMRKMAVHIGVEQVMLTRQELDQLLDDRAARAVPAVPGDAIAATGIARHQPPDIGVEHVGIGDRSCAAGPVSLRRQCRQALDVLAKKRTVVQHHLEAIVIGGIMAAGYLDAGIHF